MTGLRPCESNGEVRLVRIQLAARDALWRLAILARLREGDAISSDLVKAAGDPSRTSFAVTRNRMRGAGLIAIAGQRLGPLGFMEHVWSLPVVEMRRAA